VWEWCRDWYDENYYKQAGADRNPVGPASGSFRVFRGGSWGFVGASYCRGAFRRWIVPALRNVNQGFRLVRAV